MTYSFHASVAISDQFHLLATEIFLSYRRSNSSIARKILIATSPITVIIRFWIIDGFYISTYNYHKEKYWMGGDRIGIRTECI